MSTGSASWVIQVLVPTSEQDNIANILEQHINAISIFPDSAS